MGNKASQSRVPRSLAINESSFSASSSSSSSSATHTDVPLSNSLSSKPASVIQFGMHSHKKIMEILTTYIQRLPIAVLELVAGYVAPNTRLAFCVEGSLHIYHTETDVRESQCLNSCQSVCLLSNHVVCVTGKAPHYVCNWLDAVTLKVSSSSSPGERLFDDWLQLQGEGEEARWLHFKERGRFTDQSQCPWGVWFCARGLQRVEKIWYDTLVSPQEMHDGRIVMVTPKYFLTKVDRARAKEKKTKAFKLALKKQHEKDVRCNWCSYSLGNICIPDICPKCLHSTDGADIIGRSVVQGEKDIEEEEEAEKTRKKQEKEDKKDGKSSQPWSCDVCKQSEINAQLESCPRCEFLRVREMDISIRIYEIAPNYASLIEKRAWLIDCHLIEAMAVFPANVVVLNYVGWIKVWTVPKTASEQPIFVTKWHIAPSITQKKMVALPAERIAVQTVNGISIFEIETGKLLKTITGSADAIGSCALPDAEFLNLEASVE